MSTGTATVPETQKPSPTAASSDIKITAEPTTDSTTMKFVVDRTVIAGAVRFENAAAASGSPLGEALFALPGVSRVQVINAVVTVTKTGTDEWLPLAKQVGATLRRLLQSGQPLISDEMLARIKSADAEARAKVEEVIATSVNPAVAAHGGHIDLVDVRDLVVYVRLSGGCQGCASSTATLKMGIERMVREVVPEIVDVVDVTNHSEGSNPYYR